MASATTTSTAHDPGACFAPQALAARDRQVDDLVGAWLSRAAGAPVVLADGTDGRAVLAAARLRRAGGRALLIGSAEAVRAACGEQAVPVLELEDILDPADPALRSWILERAQRLPQLADAGPGAMTQALSDPVYLACLCVGLRMARAVVAGATRTSGDVLRAALKTLRSSSGLVSSCHLMVLPGGRVIGFADCAIVPYPDASELATIAVAAARRYAHLTQREPVVAMLSFSTKGSASHPAVARVREATERARQLAPDLRIEGELQFDAAWLPAVWQRKVDPDSPGESANVLIFPDLGSANIACKLTEHLAGARSLGSILNGLAMPVYDVSRACTAPDFFAVAAMSLVG